MKEFTEPSCRSGFAMWAAGPVVGLTRRMAQDALHEADVEVIEQRAVVMHFHRVRGLGRDRAGAVFQDGILESAGCSCHIFFGCAGGRRGDGGFIDGWGLLWLVAAQQANAAG